jgi:hypothetical protein
MRTCTRRTFDRKVANGDWEQQSDVNSFGHVQVREFVTGRRFTVKVVG